MNTGKIIIPVDFTAASDQAVKQAIAIAQKAELSIMLFHVISNDAKSKSENEDVQINLKKLEVNVLNEDVKCEYKIATGNIFDEIPAIANKPNHRMMVIGTHGIQGFKQKLLGADMLKIIRKVNIPALVIQEGCICRNFNPIVFPVGGHEGFMFLIESTALFANLFGSEVHIYSVNRKGDEGTKKLKDNTAQAINFFKEKNILIKRVEEEATVFSVGYSKQTLQYAEKVNAGLISIMSVKTEEYYYFAQADKESLINNEFNIPVLCASGAVNY
jgi:nucleotide-binding universal stress UspA family protein